MQTFIGVITHLSPFSVKESIYKIEAILLHHGATICARINQQAELQNTGQTIRRLEFILFGNPKAGGPIMIENPLVAVD